jgi:hypothetical protein
MMPMGAYAGSLSILASYLYAVPFFTPLARTVTSVAIHVNTAVTGSARLGIYNDNGNIYPGSLVIDAGTVDTGTTGLKEITALNVTLVANTLYWLSFVCSSTPYLAATAAGEYWSLLGYSTGLNANASAYYYVSFVYGSLPSTYPSGGLPYNGYIPNIAIYF